MFFRHSAVAVSAVVGAVASAGAQGVVPRDTLAPAVITATRVAVSTTAPTAATTVLRGDDLRAQGITRVSDALRLVPGMSITPGGSTGSQTSLFLRGGNSNYVRLLVDGVPVNDAGGFVDLANFTTDNISRIEVVRGPASVLYGSDAVTGVVQLFTNDGSGPATIRALTGVGSHGTTRGALSASGGSERASYSIAGARHATNGILPFNNRYTNDVLSGALRMSPGAATDVRLSARWSTATFHYPTDYTGAVVDHNSEQTDHRFVVSADAGRRFGDRVELRASFASNEFLPRSNDGPDDAADTTGFFGYFSRSVRTRRTADLRFNVRAGDRQTVTIGAEVSRERERSTSRSLSEYGPSDGAFEAARHNTGAYVQVIGDLSSRWSYTIGGRRDANSAFGVFETARGALAFVVGPGITARASAGTAFKTPSFYENFATGYVVGNPALQPERSRSAEVGIDFASTGGALAASASAYRQRFTDIVQYRGTAPAPGAPNYYNVAEATANGVELEVRWHPKAAFSATVGYSFADTRVTAAGFDSSASANYVKGERLVRRPPHTFTMALSGMTGNRTFSLVGTRVGARADRDFTTYPAESVTLPAHVKLDASATFPLGSRGFSAIVRADNLLDARYDDIVRYRAPGLTLFAGLQMKR